jgi:predicted nucleic acid-binding protein
MTTFVDTSALLALLDADEAHHQPSAAVWRDLLEHDEWLVTSNYVLVEAYALVQRRLGMDAVRVLSRHFVPMMEVDWLDEKTHEAAVAALLTAGRRNLSLVDCSSFELMRRRGLVRAFALASDFAEQGFEVVPAF